MRSTLPCEGGLATFTLKNGAVSAKILGSGAGGTLLFYAKENQKQNLIRALERNKGRTFDFRFDFEGLQVWEK